MPEKPMRYSLLRLGPVRDHGPGVSDSGARRLFHFFSKSAHEAANSAPGVGLWLDGKIIHGVCFVLALPISDKLPEV